MSDLKRRTILCVDDEQDIVDSLFDTFMDKYNVKIATSGQEALNIFKKEDISVIITDQRMPSMQGTELLTQINEIKPICKKILLTGYSDIQAAIDAINLGRVDKYITKPWDDDDLMGAVDSLISVYKVDEIFQKIIKDGKTMKTDLDNYKKHSDLFIDFLENCQQGIVIIKNDDIEYINQTGVSILGYDSKEDMSPNLNYMDIFQIDPDRLIQLKEKYDNKNYQPELLYVRLKNNQAMSVQANVAFVPDKKTPVVRGIIFSEIKQD
jgi:YesN/AraC family two-component response regulator